jgi:hypothetical protein
MLYFEKQLDALAGIGSLGVNRHSRLLGRANEPLSDYAHSVIGGTFINTSHAGVCHNCDSSSIRARFDIQKRLTFSFFLRTLESSSNRVESSS